MSQGGFSYRGFVSMLVFGTFLVMAVTGVVLYVTPPGRVAHWTDWTLLGLGKDDWAAVHISASLIFVAAGLLHLANNWKPFLHHLRERAARIGTPRREAVAAFAGVGLIVGGSIADVPPFSYLMRVNELAKGMWSLQAGREPPFGRAEEATIAVLAGRMQRPPEALVEALRSRGLEVGDPAEVVRQVADRNGMTPAAVYDAARRGLAAMPRTGPEEDLSALTPDQIRQRFADTGAGRKTLAQIAAELALEVGEAQARLQRAGIGAAPNDRLRDVGERHGLGPTDVIVLILRPDDA